MRLNEKEREEILSKYSGDTSDKVLTHLKRNFPTYEFKSDWMKDPFIQILVDEKLINMESNKKYLVGKIYNLIEDIFPNIDKKIVRRTIKKYLDGIR